MNVHAPIIALFERAKTQATISIYLGYIALACFGVFGTLASLPAYKDSAVIYWCFHYLPYVLIGLSIPFSLYHVFLMYRYRIMQFMILVIMLGFGLALPIASGIFALKHQRGNSSMALFIAMIAWFAMPYLLRVNMIRFLHFLKSP